MSQVGIVQIVERAKSHGYPALSLSTLNIEAGETGWLVASQRFSPAALLELRNQFNQIDARAACVRDDEERSEAARHRDAVARGEEQPTEEEQAIANQERIEALAAHQRHEEERPRRVEELLQRIAAAVETLSSRSGRS